MGAIHNTIVVDLRRRMTRQGFRFAKCPMPTYRPDIFAQKFSKSGKIVEEIVVEAEIESTVFSEHTSHQLVLMDEYLRHQRKKGIKAKGFLAVPNTKAGLSRAKSLLLTLFPEGHRMNICTIPVH